MKRGKKLWYLPWNPNSLNLAFENVPTLTSFWAEGLPDFMHSPYCLRWRSWLRGLSFPSEWSPVNAKIPSSTSDKPEPVPKQVPGHVCGGRKVLLMWFLLDDMRKAGPGSPQLSRTPPQLGVTVIGPLGITDRAWMESQLAKHSAPL